MRETHATIRIPRPRHRLVEQVVDRSEFDSRADSIVLAASEAETRST